MTSRFWLGVASRNHVMIGVEGGFAQVCHGKRGPLSRMTPGDGLAYYSPGVELGERNTLKSFTAIGWVLDGDIEQVRYSADFQPWRRPVQYEHDVRDSNISHLKTELELTAQPNWGYALRRGLLELSEHDFKMIAQAMLKPTREAA
jgi:EVE domain